MSSGGGKIPNFNPTNYMTIEMLEDNSSITFTPGEYGGSSYSCDYSINGTSWKTITAKKTIYGLRTGDTISFRGILNYESSVGQFTINYRCNLTGNCMAMVYGDDATSYDTAPYGCFRNLFRSCRIVSVSSDFLPATKVSNYSYDYMFMYCNYLITPPVLPAMNLATGCYHYMFGYCDALSNPPALPATTLADFCYDSMFYSCKSLEESPVLPAKTLVDACYQAMFQLCSNLKKITMLATDITAQYSMVAWVAGVASTGTFIKNKDATWDVVGVEGVPEGWTIEYQ